MITNTKAVHVNSTKISTAAEKNSTSMLTVLIALCISAPHLSSLLLTFSSYSTNKIFPAPSSNSPPHQILGLIHWSIWYSGGIWESKKARTWTSKVWTLWLGRFQQQVAGWRCFVETEKLQKHVFFVKYKPHSPSLPPQYGTHPFQDKETLASSYFFTAESI